MASELENSLKEAAAQVVTYVKDIATLKVETFFVDVGAGGQTGFDQARPAARTIIKLDSDSETIIPMRDNAGVMEVDTTLFNIHQQNVNTAIEYRARMMNALLGMLQVRR